MSGPHYTNRQYAMQTLRDLREQGGYTDAGRVAWALAAIAHALLALADDAERIATRHEGGS